MNLDDPWDDSPPDTREVEVVRQKVKAEDEVEKYLVDETLNDLQLCQAMLQGGLEVQVHNALTRLPALYKNHGSCAHHALAASLCVAKANFDPEDDIALAESYTEIVRQRHLEEDEMKQLLLPTVLQMLRDSSDEDVVDGWMLTLLELMPLLDRATLEHDVASLALAKGEVDQQVTSRALCCRILGGLAPHVDAAFIQRRFLNKAMASCQDTDYEVRICMCNQLDAIARSVGNTLLHDTVLPELMELLNDEEVAVRTAAFIGLVKMFEILGKDQAAMYLIITRFVVADDEPTQLCIAQQFGPLILQVAPLVKSEDEWVLFQSVFVDLVESGVPRIRELAAFNFPAVLSAMGPRAYVVTLHAPYRKLADDTVDEVRRCVAASFLEVARLLGKDRTVSYLKPVFLSLVRDSAKEVQGKMLAHLGEALDAFAVDNQNDREGVFADLLPAVLEAEASLGCRWRQVVAVLESFPSIVGHVSSDQLVDHLLPCCFKYLGSNLAPVKLAAAAALPCAIRRLPRLASRVEMVAKVMREYGRGRSCFQRVLFVDLCEAFMRCFSHRFCREFLVEAAVELLADPVANVRLRACMLLPNLKRMVRMPEDAALLERMSKLCTMLNADRDRDVELTARTVIDRFKVVPTHGSGQKDPTMSTAQAAEADASDAQKERQEDELLAAEEAAMKQRRDEMIAASKAKLQAGLMGGISPAARALNRRVSESSVQRPRTSFSGGSASSLARLSGPSAARQPRRSLLLDERHPTCSPAKPPASSRAKSSSAQQGTHPGK